MLTLFDQLKKLLVAVRLKYCENVKFWNGELINFSKCNIVITRMVAQSVGSSTSKMVTHQCLLLSSMFFQISNQNLRITENMMLKLRWSIQGVRLINNSYYDWLISVEK